MKRYYISKHQNINPFQAPLPNDAEYKWFLLPPHAKLQVAIISGLMRTVKRIMEPKPNFPSGGFVPQNTETNGEAVITGRKSRGVSIHFERETVTLEAVQSHHERLMRQIETLKVGDYKPKQ